MPVLIAIVLGVAGFIWWSWGRRRAGDAVAFRLDQLFRRKPCRWEPTGDDRGALREFRCHTCAVAAYGQGNKAPQDCKRNLRGGL